MKLIASLLLLIGLAACASYTPPPVDDPYTKQGWSQVLANEYAEYSKSEAEQYDWDSAKKFASKSERARSGETVMPETPDDWKIDDESKDAFDTARARLLAILERKNAKDDKLGPKTARAQLLFDCWLKEHSEKKTDESSACKDEFFYTLNELEQALGIAKAAPDKE
ncbi:hypothetical protein GC177_02920 [bacterium]|nr:hypothetical protein [bacterium]